MKICLEFHEHCTKLEFYDVGIHLYADCIGHASLSRKIFTFDMKVV